MKIVVFSHFTVTEELLKILPMKGGTTGEDPGSFFKFYRCPSEGEILK